METVNQEKNVVAENEEGMYLIDQHAAAERINYEKYFYHDKTAAISDNDRDKILGELIVTF